MDSDERRNKIIVGAVVIVVTVAIVALILLKTSGAALTCQLSDVEPIKQDKPKNVNSEDNKALAHFDGYLKYELADAKNKKVFLPLELESVRQFDEKDGTKTLELNLNCAQVNVTLKSDSKTISAKEVQVKLNTPNDKIDSCTILSGLQLINYGTQSYFSCADFELVCEASSPTPAPAPTPSPTTLPPSTIKPPAQTSDAEEPASAAVFGPPAKVVTLKIKKIAFELDGDVEKHKKLDFSKKEQGCEKPKAMKAIVA